MVGKVIRRHELSVLQMRMLWLTSRNMRKYKIENGCIMEKVVVVAINKEMTKSPPRWFSYMRRRPVEVPVRRVNQLEDNSKTKENSKREWRSSLFSSLHFSSI